MTSNFDILKKRSERRGKVRGQLPFRTTDEFDDILLRINHTGDLQRFFERYIESSGTTQKNALEDILSCGSTSNVVTRFLSFSRIKESPEQQLNFTVGFNEEGRHWGGVQSVTVADMTQGVAAQRLLTNRAGRPCVAILRCLNEDHVVTLAETGSGWCLYQSNVGEIGAWATGAPAASTVFTVSDNLNMARGRGRRQLHNLSDAELVGLFDELVRSGNKTTLFFGPTSFLAWQMLVFTLDGHPVDMTS